MSNNKNSRENQFRFYPIKYEKITKLPYNDPKVDELIAANEPVVITDTELVSSAKTWDINYLEKHMGSGTFTVITSKNHKFKYYDEKKVSALTSNFFPVTKRSQMGFMEFVKKIKTWRKGEERVYLQQPIDNSVGTTIAKDFVNFNWRWVTEKQIKHKWGPMTSNLLLISMPGNVTPCHYDEQQNFYAQIKGIKKCILFRPSQFDSLYPHPVHHPYDRQSQVDFDRPDYTRFPNFRNITGFETILEPGDVLYIPVYWFHHMESRLRGSYTISVNFWYKTGPTGQVTYPLKDYQKVAIMRNIEKMLGEALHDNKEVGTLLKTLVSGRYE